MSATGIALQRPDGGSSSTVPLCSAGGGRYCATNPVSILVPCHRAVREDGGLGGYRWGLKRKQALLKAEGAEAGAYPARRSGR